MARYKVYLWQSAQGWHWAKSPNEPGWGPYKTEKLATSAAMRSLNPAVGGKIDKSRFEFIPLETPRGNPKP